MNPSRSPRSTGLVIGSATGVAVLGGFLLGYDNLVISGTLDYIARSFSLLAMGTGVAASAAQLGALAGALAIGVFADRFGLKRPLYVCAALFIASCVGVYCSRSFAVYLVWRVICGIASGAAAITAPMYIAEVSPARWRGRLVTSYQMGIVTGIASAAFVNMLIQKHGDDAWNTLVGWRYMFLAGALPSLAFIGAILLGPESPRWLIKVNRRAEGERILRQVNGPDADEVLREIDGVLDRSECRLSELFSGPFRRPLLIGVILAACSQLSGITVILSYLPEVFKAAGAASADAFFQATLVGWVNIAFSLVALWFIDRAGRRILLLVGTVIQAAALSTIAYLFHTGTHGWLAVIGIMVFMAGHAVGNGATCWVLIAEIFPLRVRGRAMSFATTSMFFASYLGLLLFPTMRQHFGDSGTFVVFAGFAAANWLFVVLNVPETKSMSLESIEKLWIRNDP